MTFTSTARATRAGAFASRPSRSAPESRSGTHAHLRSTDFFAADEYPHFRFELAAVASDADHNVTLTGTLHIRDQALPIETPVSVTKIGPDVLRLGLEADLKVDHAPPAFAERFPKPVRVQAARSDELTLHQLLAALA